jgi:hypothetical protein
VDKENNSCVCEFGNPPDSDLEGSGCDDEDYGHLTYLSVKANCEEMCQYVQNDQLQLAQLKLLTDYMVISSLRKLLNIHATFVDILGEGGILIL